jgi:catechol 2,3-dioxygenase-like lactoylglutathione lyase family enzyme
MKIRSLVPMASVASVPRSIAFYKKLGFEIGNTHAPEGESEPVWAWIRSDKAHLMLAQAEGPVARQEEGVLFYLYCDDVLGFQKQLLEDGLEAGEVTYPFYAPRGEFRVIDPDGYTLMVSHT